MRKRITIMLDEQLEKKVRLLQAQKIQKTRKAVSFSDALEAVVGLGLKNKKGKHDAGFT